MFKVALAVFTAVSLVSCGGGSGDVLNADASSLQAGSAAPIPVAEAPAKANVVTPFVAGEVTVANSTNVGDQVLRTVGATADGGYVVAWSSAGTGLTMQGFDSSGAKAGAETAIVIDTGARTPAAAAQALEQASMAVLPDGSVVVLYKVSRDVDIGGGMTQSTTGLYVQRFGSNGAATAAATLVDSVPDLGPKSPFIARASVTALSDGGFVVAWTVAHYSTFFSSTSTLSLRWFGSDAQVAGAPVQVGEFPELAYSVAPDNHGGFALTIMRTDNFYKREAEVEAYDAAHAFVEIVPPTLRSIVIMPLAGGYVIFEGDSAGATEQLLDAHGNATVAATPIPMLPAAASELADGTYVTLQSAGNGAYAVTWFGADMAPLAAPLSLNSRGVMPQLASLADPAIAASWTGASANSGTDVYTQRFTETLSSGKKACLTSARQQHLTGATRKAFVTGCTG